MKVLTSTEMKRMDKYAMEKLGIIGPVLMENAGLEIVRAVLERFPDIAREKVVVVAGKGNNGGDGFVVARHLFNRGVEVRVLLLGRKRDLQGDAALNLNMVNRIGIAIKEITSEDTWKRARKFLKTATILIDAVFGTGLTKPAAGLYAKVIRDINRSPAFRAAVDIPSGLSSDCFRPIGPAVEADLTVTMAAPKIAHVFAPTEQMCGELVVADISLPPRMFDDPRLKLEMVEERDVAPCFKKRPKDGHKGSFGHLLVLAGSRGKTGAAGLAGKAALKTGAGLVTVGLPESCLPAVARSMLELMTEPLSETGSGSLAPAAEARIQELLEGKDALMLGPGISTDPGTAELILDLLPQVKIPMVIDADGLNILARSPGVLKKLKGPVVLTPHPGEFARLAKVSNSEAVENKLKLVPKLARRYGVYVVFKSYRTLTASPDGRVYINPTGNPGMATGGSGDVLSGMLGSMIMQGPDLLSTVLSAVYVHGLAGDLAADRFGEKPLVAGNLIAQLPAAVKHILSTGPKPC
jgi:NAD(P)H-hydrate epimerase